MDNTVSKSKLKAHALKYFRQVEETGRELVVTDRGRPVLKIVPYQFDASEQLSVLKESVVRYEDPLEPVGLDDLGVAGVIVLDTHAWVWWVSQSSELSSSAGEAIEAAAAEGDIRVSSISAWEVAMLVASDRLELRMDLEDWLAEAESLPFLRFVPVDNRIAAQLTRLPGSLHADPADRMIVATARALGAPLVTKDRKLRRYRHVTTIW